jgi:hypothetical protein
MPDVYQDSSFDDPARWTYWRSKPADHNVAGFFVDGPQPATPPMNKQAAPGRWHQVGKLQDAPAHEPRAARAASLSRQRAAAYRRLAAAIQKAA